METIKAGVDIEGSAERIFEYLEHAEHHPEWLPSLVEVRNVTGSGAGAHHEWTYKMAGLRIEGETTIVDYVPAERLVLEVKGGSEGRWTFAMSPAERGTHLDLTVDYTIPLPVLGKLAEKAVIRRNEREIEVAVQNIKDYCEG